MDAWLAFVTQCKLALDAPALLLPLQQYHHLPLPLPLSSGSKALFPPPSAQQLDLLFRLDDFIESSTSSMYSSSTAASPDDAPGGHAVTTHQAIASDTKGLSTVLCFAGCTALSLCQDLAVENIASALAPTTPQPQVVPALRAFLRITVNLCGKLKFIIPPSLTGTGSSYPTLNIAVHLLLHKLTLPLTQLLAQNPSHTHPPVLLALLEHLAAALRAMAAVVYENGPSLHHLLPLLVQPPPPAEPPAEPPAAHSDSTPAPPPCLQILAHPAFTRQLSQIVGAASESPCLDVRRMALTTLANLCIKTNASAQPALALVYPSILKLLSDNLEQETNCLLPLAQTPAHPVRTKMLISVCKALSRAVAASHSVFDSMADVLARLKLCMFYGLSVSVIHNSVMDALEDGGSKSIATAVLGVPLFQAGSFQDPISSSLPSPASLRAAEATAAPLSTAAANPSRKPFGTSPADSENEFTVGILSSEDVSDAEFSGHRVRSAATKTRMAALNALQSIAKFCKKRDLHPFWPSFIPDSPTVQTPTLLTSILHDPNPKCRLAAVNCLGAFLDGAKQFLSLADDSPISQQSFTPFSRVLGLRVVQLHAGFVAALAVEPNSHVLVQLLRSLALLINNCSYSKLTDTSYLKRAALAACSLLGRKDPNVRVAALTCLNAVYGASPLHSETRRDLLQLQSLPLVSGVADASPHALFPHLVASLGPRELAPVRLETSQLICSIALHHFEFLKQLILAPPAEGLTWGKFLQAVLANATDSDGNVRLFALRVLETLASALHAATTSSQSSSSSSSSLSSASPSSSTSSAAAAAGDSSAMDADMDDDSGFDSLRVPEKPQSEQALESLSALTLACSQLWRTLFESSLLVSLFQDSSANVRAAACDLLSRIGHENFSRLPPDQAVLTVTLLLGMNDDGDGDGDSVDESGGSSTLGAAEQATPSMSSAADVVRAAACRTLGVFVLFPSFQEDIAFFTDAARAVVSGMRHSSVNVRIRASWALGNLGDALILAKSRTKADADEQLLVDDFPASCLFDIAEAALQAAKDNDKIRSNAMRALGNAVGFADRRLYESLSEKGVSFSTVVGAIMETLAKSCTSGPAKVRWNACHAIGNALRNSFVAGSASRAPWMKRVLSSLVACVTSSKNSKVRINAAAALMAPTQPECYGLDPDMKACRSAVAQALEMADNITDAAELKYQRSLKQQLSATLQHLERMMALEGGGRVQGAV